MKRSELEALSTSALQQLIVDATAVLAARALGAGTASTATRASNGGIFAFGPTSNSTSNSLPATGSGAGVFAPLPRVPASGSTPSSNLFGSTSGIGPFGAHGGAAPLATAVSIFDGGLFGYGVRAGAPAASGEEEEEVYVKEEEVVAVHGWAPSLTLELKDQIETGEESEEVLYSQRSKLYRFRGGEWKERGLGDSKLLKDKETGRVRYLLRQEKTLKVVSNHYVIDTSPYCELRANCGSDKAWVWTAQDYADGKMEVERFCLKFGTLDSADAFKDAFEDAKRKNVEVLKGEAEKVETVS